MNPMNKVQINKEFNDLVRYLSVKYKKYEEKDYKSLLEWANKNDNILNQNIKSTDYMYYFIVFLIIIIILVIILIYYYSEDLTTESLDSLLDENNKSSYIEVEEY